jgi:N-acetyl-alpha-D-muramate 1-phosphate uridylyltransferase
MRAMILAAGRGERMRPLTDSAPKPLLTVGGKALIEYHIEALAKAGVQDIVINLAWRGSMLREALGDGEHFAVRLHYSDEGSEALETGGGVFKALPLLGPDPFIVVSGDIWTDYPMQRLLEQPRGADTAHFIMVPNPSFHPRGDFSLQDGRISEAPAPRYTYANIGVFTAEFFGECEPGRFPLVPIMRRWIRENRVSGELYEGEWRNIGTPAQLAELDSYIREKGIGDSG